MTRQSIAVVAALASLSGPVAAGAVGVEGLVGDADLIAAVQILSIDDTAMPADGPMYVEARVLKLVKGSPRATSKLRFGASAWVGPTYRPGEVRLVFLTPIPGGHAYYDKVRWTSVEAGKVDLFLAREALKDCSEASLLEFLRKIETAGDSPPKFECKFLRDADANPLLSVNLVNGSDQTVWLNPSRMMTSIEASQAKYALAVHWNQGGDGEWIPLQSGSTLSGHASVDTKQLDDAREVTITLGHLTARFPHSSWVGFRSVAVKTQE